MSTIEAGYYARCPVPPVQPPKQALLAAIDQLPEQHLDLVL